MKKVIRLTESDLINIVQRIMNESYINEQLLGKVVNKFLSKSEPKIVSKTSSRLSRPLINQLSSEVTGIIAKLPKKIKIGDKLIETFKKSEMDIISLEGSLSNIYDAGFTQFGTSKSLITKVKKIMKNPKGTEINLSEIYQDLNLVKKDLENLKNMIKSKKSWHLNQMGVKNIDKFLYSNETQLNRVINNINEFIKQQQIKPK